MTELIDRDTVKEVLDDYFTRIEILGTVNVHTTKEDVLDMVEKVPGYCACNCQRIPSEHLCPRCGLEHLALVGEPVLQWWCRKCHFSQEIRVVEGQYDKPWDVTK